MLDRMAADLSRLRAAAQFRELAVPTGIQLGSNDYLGLSRHPQLKQAIMRALEADTRVASTGSRLMSGNHERWEQLESEFAEFLGVEAALYFPSGYAANPGSDLSRRCAATGHGQCWKNYRGGEHLQHGGQPGAACRTDPIERALRGILNRR